MKKKDITFKRLALETQVPKTTLFTWTSGVNPKSINYLKSVADYFGVEVHYLLYGKPDSMGPINPQLTRDKKLRATLEISLDELRLHE